MRRYLWAAILLLVSVTSASAQGSKVNIQCLTGVSGFPWDNCSTTYPFPVQVTGSSPTGIAPYSFTPSTGPEQHGLGVVTATSLTVPADALFARICVSGNGVRWTASGTPPTATVGQPQVTGQCDFFSGRAYLLALQFIQTAATATLDVVYSK